MNATKALALEKLLDRTSVDTLGPFLGGFGAVTVQGITNSGGVISDIDRYTDEGSGQVGLRVGFNAFVYVKPDGKMQREKSPKFGIELVRGLEILLYHDILLIVRDSTGTEIVIYPRAQSVLGGINQTLIAA